MDSMLPGSAALTDLVEKQLMVVLRDGRHLKGMLATYDQFANIVLIDTKEYIYDLDDKTLGIITHGHFIIRGENVGILGQCSDDESDSVFRVISSEEALDKHHRKTASGYEKICKDSKTLLASGFCPVVSFTGGDKSEYFHSLR